MIRSRVDIMPLSGGRPVAGTVEVARAALISARSMSSYLDRDTADAQLGDAHRLHRRGARPGLSRNIKACVSSMRNSPSRESVRFRL